MVCSFERDLACNLIPADEMRELEITPMPKSRRKQVRKALAREEMECRIDNLRRHLAFLETERGQEWAIENL